MGLICRKLCRLLLMFSTGFTSLCLTSFSSLDHLPCLCARCLILFHLTLMRFSRSTHLLVFVFGDFNVHHRNWSTYSGGTDKFGELSYNFSISNDLTQMPNFPTQTVFLTVLLFWNSFFLPKLVSVLHWLSLHWLILIMLLSQFPLSFHHIQNGMPLFIA